MADNVKTLEGEEKKSRSKKPNSDKTFDIIGMVIIAIMTVLAFYPMWYTLIGSLNKGSDYEKGGVFFLPRSFTFDNYKAVILDERIWSGLIITLLRCLTGPIMTVLFTALVAYGMSRKELHFKKFFNIMGLISMFFSGGTIPFYILIKLLGMLNTFWVYIIPGMYSVYNMILVRAYFKSIPEELHEAMVVDGANEFRIFWTIYLPCSLPILSTIFIWGLIGHWNDWLTSQIYAPARKDLQVLQYVVQIIISEGGSSSVSGDLPAVIAKNVSSTTISLAAMIFTTLPMFIAFPIFQKYLGKGGAIGSLKG